MASIQLIYRSICSRTLLNRSTYVYTLIAVINMYSLYLTCFVLKIESEVLYRTELASDYTRFVEGPAIAICDLYEKPQLNPFLSILMAKLTEFGNKMTSCPITKVRYTYFLRRDNFEFYFISDEIRHCRIQHGFTHCAVIRSSWRLSLRDPSYSTDGEWRPTETVHVRW